VEQGIKPRREPGLYTGICSKGEGYGGDSERNGYLDEVKVNGFKDASEGGGICRRAVQPIRSKI
jgi:hypothetical protein